MSDLAINPLTQRTDVGSTGRIERLDSIRFVAALWVFLSHGAYSLKSVPSDPVTQKIVAAFSASFDGISAVVIFFIISGLCIHLPYVNVRKVPVAIFLVRRYVRIGVPLVAVLLIMQVLGGMASEKGHDVLWSIYAELIYYTLYPLLFLLARRFGWGALIAMSAIISVVLVVTHLRYTHVVQFDWLVWLWGLPIWLLGCSLAERIREDGVFDVPCPIWLWRLGVWLLGAAATFDVFHSPMRIGYPTTMLAFAVFAFYWLSKELRISFHAWGWLERFGAASYSLYLIHNIVLGGIEGNLQLPQSAAAIFFSWVSVAAATYIFYKVVEAPSHRLARRAANGRGK